MAALTDEAELAEVQNKPVPVDGGVLKGKGSYRGHVARLGLHVVLQLQVEHTPALRVHHQERKVQVLLGAPSRDRDHNIISQFCMLTHIKITETNDTHHSATKMNNYLATPSLNFKYMTYSRTPCST